jgi:hypothetical protein
MTKKEWDQLQADVQRLEAELRKKRAKVEQAAKALEYVLLDFVCAEREEDFSVLMARMNKANHFEVHRIIGHDEVDNILEKYLHEGNQRFDITNANFTSHALTFSGWRCICGWDGDPNFCECGRCGRLVCGARSFWVREADYFVCGDKCGYRGRIIGDIDAFSAYTVIDKHKALPGKQKLLNQANVKRLPTKK